MLSIRMLQAAHGDCLVLEAPGPDGSPRRMLVDGGPRGIYQRAVLPWLEGLRRASGTTPVIDALMVSHVDDDHIRGVLDLLSAIRDAREDSRPPPAAVLALVHNSLDALRGEPEGGIAARLPQTAPAVLASTGLAATSLATAPVHADSHPAAYILQSYAQGSRAAGLAQALAIPVNPPDGALVAWAARGRTRFGFGAATLQVIGPLQSEVNRLQRAWARWQKAREGAARDRALQAFVAYADQSEPNLSSLVVLAGWQGRSILLTGDARGDRILAGLKAARLLDRGGGIDLDVLKVPHHGSDRNVETEFFARVRARHYLVSANGLHANPDRAMLQMLHDARPEGGFTVWLTYTVAEILQTLRAELAGDGKPFDPARHDITPVVAALRALPGVRVEEGVGPLGHRIDLPAA